MIHDFLKGTAEMIDSRRKKIIYILLHVFCPNPTAHASCGMPFDAAGRPMAVPNGNVPYIQVPNVFCGSSGEQTWDVMGTVENSNQEKFSIQAVEVQAKRTLAYTLGNVDHASGLGFHEFYFTFQKNDREYYVNSAYGGDENVLQALKQSVVTVDSQASNENFQVSSHPLFSVAKDWSFSLQNTTPYDGLYLGYVGQPGAVYELKGTGQTYLWSYDKTGHSAKALYHYDFRMTVRDERGVITQGFGGGYVGPVHPESVTTPYTAEYEISQPQLAVLSWKLDLLNDEKEQNSFEKKFYFMGNKGMLFQDLGPVQFVNTSQKKALQLVTDYAKNGGNLPEKSLTENHTSPALSDEKPLYRGNWLYLQFDKGIYAGSVVESTIFWNHTVATHPLASSDHQSLTKFGWAALYTGILPNNMMSPFSLVEPLIPTGPESQPFSDKKILPQDWQNPFAVEITKKTPTQFHMYFPWAQEIHLTIRDRSLVRFGLAGYANQHDGQWNHFIDSGRGDEVFQLKALSPVAQNTLFHSKISQFYEGAAVVQKDGENVGYGWIEQME